MLLAAIFDTRHLYDMHSSLPNQLVNFNFGNNRLTIGLFRWLEKRVINSCDAMITIGPDLEQHARNINPSVPHQMIENLPMRTKLSEAEVQRLGELRAQFGCDEKLLIVYAGSFERYQGIELLLESARAICRQHPQVVFVLVGGRPDQVASLEQLAKRDHLEERVVFTGTLPVEEANLILEMAHILVSPRMDGTSVPSKIYTYLHMGKAIMATDLPAHNLVLNEENAVLVQPDLAGIVAGLNRLIEDEALRKRLGEAGARLAEEKYSLANYLAKLEKIYQVLQPVEMQAQTQVQQVQVED
jgi:glycosyltransferase involved in cell wall biosynthesis